MEVCGEERSSDSDRWGHSPPSPRCSLWYYTRWQCCHVTGMHPVFPAERSRMLLMLIGSFSQQAPPCAPANNKRPRCLLRLINQTNAIGGTKHVCKCTWAFLTCLPVYMAGGSGGFVHLCVCVRANALCGRCQRMAWVNSMTEFCFSHKLLSSPLYVWQLYKEPGDGPVIGQLGLVCLCLGAGWRKHLLLFSNAGHTDGWSIQGKTKIKCLSKVSGHQEPPDQLQYCVSSQVSRTLSEG